MVVVNYSAEAFRIEKTETTGADDKRVTTRVTEPVDVDVTIELPAGHPNLDAYPPSVAPDVVAEHLQYDYTPDDVEVDTRTITCDISGTADEWITAADAWMVERVDETYRETLERFGGWEETGRGPSRALEQLESMDEVSV